MATDSLRKVETEADFIDLENAIYPTVEGAEQVTNPDALDMIPWVAENGANAPLGSDDFDWVNLLSHHSQLVMVVVSVETALGLSPTYAIRFANDYFTQLTGFSPAEQTSRALLEGLSLADQRDLRDRFRRHCLNGLLQAVFGTADLVSPRLRSEPLVVSLTHRETGQVRQVELRLRTNDQGVQVSAIDPKLEVSLRACWPEPPTRQQVTTELLTPDSPLNQLLSTLRSGRYAAQGLVLIEGVDVTERETSKALIQLLVGREPVVGTEQFSRANKLIKQLFGADDSLLLIAENQQAKLFMELEERTWHDRTYALEDLLDSMFIRATEQGEVIAVPDLINACDTQCEKDLVAAGVRSLLLIPLVMRAGRRGGQTSPMLGLVGLTSNQPFAFSRADCSLATTLIPALNASMRYSVRDRFTNIHPSVRWRFEQETERLSLGLPPAPIMFEGVYPLYGISDIRGSSDERNRAIQTDLLAQFRLALAVVDAVIPTVQNALVEQLRLDMDDRLATLEQGVTVDAEVTLLRYLQTEVEAHFGYFAEVSPAAREAIDRYQAAIDPEHGCVYTARAVYDQTISYINNLLRDTWNHWQQSMQAITPHYCDLEATDGIDHMIYAGQAIDPSFTDFQLKALRYEQLRAVCNCARQGFALKRRYDTDMVITHLVLVQGITVDIVHDETTERLFDVRGTRDTRYEIVKKRIDKACDAANHARITQPGMLTVVYSTSEEWDEYERYLRYLHREGLVSDQVEQGLVEPLQGVSGLKFARVAVLPDPQDHDQDRD